MESKTKNRKNRQQIAAMAARAFNGLELAPGENAITELKEGWFNVAYNIQLAGDRQVILKIAPPAEAEILCYEKNIMESEVTSMRLVHQDPSIPVPEIYYFDTSLELCDSAYFFMEKLAGENYEHVKKSLPADTVAQIDHSSGLIVRAINQYTGSYFGLDGNRDLRAATWQEAFLKLCHACLEDGIRKGAEYQHPIEEIQRAIHQHVPALESIVTPVMVHWDLWDSNIFVKDGKITGILDFERVMWAEPLMEAHFRYLSWNGVTQHMVGYGKTSFSQVELQRCALYTLYLGLIMKTECYYRNYGTDEISTIALNIIAGSMKWLQEN